MFGLTSKFKFRNFFLPFLFLAFLLSFTEKADAATLSFSPSSASVSVGNIVSVKVVVNTLGEAINNAEAIIQFPSDLLEVISVSKSSSVFSLWVEEPIFSNLSGTIKFNGGVANPGFNGSNGSIVSITFKAKSSGTASILFTDAAVRKNDGSGTDILTSKNSGVVRIGVAEVVDVPVVSGAILPKPVISSETHPDQMAWYALNTASFNWKIPAGVTSLETLFNKNQNSVPSIKYDSSVSQKTLNNISDGTYYFHLRYANSVGYGPVAHYQFNIDTTAPDPFIPTIRTSGNKNLIKLNAEDATSGIDYYTIQIDDNQMLKIKKTGLVENEYPLPVLKQDNHKLIIIAYDKAGNHREASLDFQSPFITVPSISLSSNSIVKGETVIISGKTDYGDNQVEITLNLEGRDIKKYKQTPSPDGSFSLTTERVDAVGSISIWAENVFGNSVRSQPSQKLYLKVDEPVAVKVTLALFWLILIIILFTILLFILYEGWHKFFGLKKEINQELESVVKDAHKAMILLKEELNSQLDVLEKAKVDRSLNKKEETIFKEIQKNVNDVDLFIEKKLKKLM
ncbi:MAG: cohesin domain-containing protein [Patescibacteria group bacterium]